MARIGTLLRRADVVKVSADDLAYLSPSMGAVDAARALLDAGARVVLMTDGAHAVHVLTGSFERVIPVPSMPVVDTIGAGDSFGGGFVARWVERALGRPDLGDGDALDDAVRYGDRGGGDHLRPRRSGPADRATNWPGRRTDARARYPCGHDARASPAPVHRRGGHRPRRLRSVRRGRVGPVPRPEHRQPRDRREGHPVAADRSRPPGDVDGIFGEPTRTAVKAFQIAKGIHANGVVGEDTWQALVRTVQPGETGPAVSALQRELRAKRHIDVPVDGVYGASTRAGVRTSRSTPGSTSPGS